MSDNHPTDEEFESLQEKAANSLYQSVVESLQSNERAQAFGEAMAQSLRESVGELRRSGAVMSVGDNLKPGVTREMVEEAAEALDSEFESRPKTDTRFFAEFMREQAARARVDLAVMTAALDVTMQMYIDLDAQIKKEQ